MSIIIINSQPIMISIIIIIIVIIIINPDAASIAIRSTVVKKNKFINKFWLFCVERCPDLDCSPWMISSGGERMNCSPNAPLVREVRMTANDIRRSLEAMQRPFHPSHAKHLQPTCSLRSCRTKATPKVPRIKGPSKNARAASGNVSLANGMSKSEKEMKSSSAQAVPSLRVSSPCFHLAPPSFDARLQL